MFFSNAHKEEQYNWHEIFIFLLSRKQQKKKKPTMDGNSIEYIRIDLDFFNICIFVSLREGA